MHKCIVCFNCSKKTKKSRPDVIYHTFPKNDYRRRKWLKVFGIALCYDWHRICSDHFLDTDYKGGQKRYLLPNTVPQPYNPNYNQDNFSDNTQSNRRQIDNNDTLPVSQNILIEEQINETVETVVNNFESPRRSSRKIKLTTTNEDMSYENMPSLQTQQYERRVSTDILNDQANENNQSVHSPILPAYKDHSLGSGVRCSVKSCSNRYSKNLSFFGFPKNIEIRKQWIEKCGLLDLDPTKKIKNSLKVCRKHFEGDCFLNTAKMNRLKSDAVPTLFLDNDITDERNIPSTSSSVNNGSIINFVDKPSCSSSNYSTNEETNQSQLAYVSETVTCFSKDLNCIECCVPGCINSKENIKNKPLNTDDEFLSLFKPPPEYVSSWSSNLGLPLTVESIVCGNHFKPQDVVDSKLKINGKKKVLKTLALNALPVRVNDNTLLSANTTDVMLDTNTRPALKTYQGYKRSKTNKNEEYLSVKKFRNDYEIKSNSTAETIYTSGNDNMCTSATNDINNCASTSGKNPTLKSNTVKIPLMNTDNFSTSNTSQSCFEGSLPKIIANSTRSLSNVEPSTSSQITTIDGFEETVRHESLEEYQIRVNENFRFNCTPNGGTVITDKQILHPSAAFFKGGPRYDNASDSLPTNFDQTTETQDSVHDNLQANMIQSGQNWSVTPKQTIQQSIVNSTRHAIPIIEPKNIKCEPVENDDEVLPPQLTSIDDSSSIELSNIKQKIQKITANNSLSITLERVENTKVTESSENLLPKSIPKSSMTISLQPKLKNNLSLTNSSPSVTLAPRLSSASNNSVCNESQHSSTQYEQASISTLNVPSSINQHRPTTNKILKAVPTAQKKVVSKPCELKILDYYSLLDPIPNDTSALIINNINLGEKLDQKDNGFIHEVSKSMTLPSIYWMTLHDISRNVTVFVQRNDMNDAVKKVNFYNSLTPVIQIYGMAYEHNTPIKTKIELETLLEKIDTYEKCSGQDGFTHENCIGYFEVRTEYIEMCSACQQLIRDQDLHKTKALIESKSKTIENLQNRISERKIKVCEARKKLEKQKNTLRVFGALYPSPNSNVMKPHQ
ncbi:hypothetical protein AGLY_010251 [Aphis glycines]|uniref:THAP-type domain-containing protein n=1 Tax=Aphis glycines TaxID=307491 RepID=A0A6G0TFH3_APHGL|nr:hypothetical protein AGLY_010251 [Aphis glycines]